MFPFGGSKKSIPPDPPRNLVPLALAGPSNITTEHKHRSPLVTLFCHLTVYLGRGWAHTVKYMFSLERPLPIGMLRLLRVKNLFCTSGVDRRVWEGGTHNPSHPIMAVREPHNTHAPNWSDWGDASLSQGVDA
ncbi:hypothetical protein Bbelb_194770 [Branchiostoma belcheri]|nr:hypothetical protein Bbelb_194770 [Branchiostoma belcheri]